MADDSPHAAEFPAARLPPPRSLPQPDIVYAALIAAFIRRRVELGLTQADIDHRAGFTEACTAKYENGDRRPSAFALCLWACAMNSIVHTAPLTAPADLAVLAQRAPWRVRGVARKRGRRRRAA